MLIHDGHDMRENAEVQADAWVDAPWATHNTAAIGHLRTASSRLYAAMVGL